jgi:hypothetical protein
MKATRLPTVTVGVFVVSILAAGCPNNPSEPPVREVALAPTPPPIQPKKRAEYSRENLLNDMTSLAAEEGKPATVSLLKGGRFSVESFRPGRVIMLTDFDKTFDIKDKFSIPALRAATTIPTTLAIKCLMKAGENPRDMIIRTKALQDAGSGVTGRKLVKYLARAEYERKTDSVKFKLLPKSP